MKLHKNRLFPLLLNIVLLPMVAGNCLHLFFGCPEENCSLANLQDQADHTSCRHDHSSHHQNTDSKPITSGENSCFICKFLAIPRIVPVFTVWNPGTLLWENHDLVFPSSDVATYQNFEFGRAPPFFA